MSNALRLLSPLGVGAIALVFSVAGAGRVLGQSGADQAREFQRNAFTSGAGVDVDDDTEIILIQSEDSVQFQNDGEFDALGSANRDLIELPSFRIRTVDDEYEDRNSTVYVRYEFPKNLGEQSFNPRNTYDITDPLTGETILPQARCGAENSLPVVVATVMCDRNPSMCEGPENFADLFPSSSLSVSYDTGLSNDDDFSRGETFRLSNSNRNDQSLVLRLELLGGAKTSNVVRGINPYGVVNVAPLILFSATNGCYE